MRWSDRVIGFVTTIVLARLLAPDDFGIVAMASLVLALADVAFDLGVNVALIRNPDVTHAHYNTAWTLRLVQAAASTLVLILLAPLAADYFHDDRIAPVLRVLAFSLLLSGCENIGVVAFQKKMQFGAEFRYLFMRRVAGSLIAILLAWQLRSYWGLVIGILGGRAIGVVLSYSLHPMRPWFSLERGHEIFAISQWLFIRGIGSYLHANLHKILVGRWSGTATLGAYNVANDIAEIPSGELLAPLNRVLFPAFAEAQKDPQVLKRLYLYAQGVQTFIAVPTATGLALIAQDAIRLLLGERWIAAVPFVQILAFVGIAQSLTTSGNHVLMVLGKVRSLVLLTWTQVAVFVVLAGVLLGEHNALGIAWLRLLIAVGGIALAFALLVSAFPIVRWQDITRANLRPLTAAAVMAAAILALPWPPELSLIWSLLLKTSLGGVIYLAVAMGTWLLLGCPDGAESNLITQLRRLAGRAGRATREP